MGFNLDNKLVVAVSARALFDLALEHDIYETQGLEAYWEYQLSHEDKVLLPGPGFPLVKALLNLNRLPGMKDRVEIIIMSRNSEDTSLRIFHSIRHYGLGITRAVLSGGASLVPYLKAFRASLYLSAWEEDVQAAVNQGIAGAIICAGYERMYDGRRTGTGMWAGGKAVNPDGEDAGSQLRIAFDGDAVLFTDESERIFRQYGLEAFEEYEERYAAHPLQEGPFAEFLQVIARIQKEFPQDVGTEAMPIRTALVTSRRAPAHERVIRTLRTWGVRIDEAFFLGGISKRDILEAFGAHIFFDDQALHAESAAEVVPAARVPYRSRERIGDNNHYGVWEYQKGNLSGEAQPVYCICRHAGEKGDCPC